MYIFDEREVWFYIYGYQKLGYQCPTVVFSDHKEIVSFFQEQVDVIFSLSGLPSQIYANKPGFGAL